MFKKLKILSLSLIGIMGGLMPSMNNQEFVVVKADNSDVGYTSTKLNWGYGSKYTGEMYWNDTNNPLDHVNDVESIAEGGKFYSFYPAKYDGLSTEELFGDLYSYFDDSSKEIADHIYTSLFNLNYYGSVNNYSHIGFSFRSDLLRDLVRLANDNNVSFKIPCITLDSETLALFDVNKSGINVLSPNSIISSVNVVYDSYNSLVGSNPGHSDRERIDYIVIVFTIKPNLLRKISECAILEYYGAGVPIYLDKSDFCYESCYSMALPYDITYFDFSQGSICLGHSFYGDDYGTSEPNYLLDEVEFELYHNGSYQTHVWSSMTFDEYQTFIVSGLYSEDEKRAALSNKIVYGPRGTYENEVSTGSGGLIWEPYCPYNSVDISKSSKITIKRLTFVPRIADSLFVDKNNPDDAFSYYLPDGAMEFSYFADKAIGRCSVELFETNIDTGGRSVHTNWWNYVLGAVGIGMPWWGYLLTDNITTNVLNRGLNIQRFYFNIKDNYNQLIPNVKKIQFKYQQGNKEIKKDYNNDGTLDIGLDSNLPILTATKELTDSTVSEYSNFFNSVSFEGNGFVSIENDPQELTSETGITNSYSYYYQNVYHTKDSDSGKAYYDHISYYSMLSVWYETTVGQTIRLTTDYDGYYLTTGFDGELIVMNINDPENPSNMSIEDFNKRDVDQRTFNFDDGKETSTDEKIDKIDDFFGRIGKNLSDFWNKSKTILSIVLGVVAFLVLFVIVIKFASLLGNFSNANELRKLNKENKRKRKEERRKNNVS